METGGDCAVCFNTYKFDNKALQPVAIACGHSYCRGCLLNVRQGDSKCPTCRKPFSGEVANMPPNYGLQHALEAVAAAQQAQVGNVQVRVMLM